MPTRKQTTLLFADLYERVVHDLDLSDVAENADAMDDCDADNADDSDDCDADGCNSDGGSCDN